MAAKKRQTGSTPPSERPERAGSAELAEREWPVWPEQVVGAKHIRSLERIIDALHESNAHGNRVLFLDDVFIAYLLAFFNPALLVEFVGPDLSGRLKPALHSHSIRVSLMAVRAHNGDAASFGAHNGDAASLRNGGSG